MKRWGFLLGTAAFAASAASFAAPTNNSWVINADVVDTADYPEVIQIRTPMSMRDPKTGKMLSGIASCTATVVGPHAILTAAHCGETGTITRFTANGRQYEAELHRSADYLGQDPDSPDVGMDLSIGIVEETIQGVKPVSIGGNAKVGLGLIFLGFGCHNIGGLGGSDGKLRLGETVATLLDGFDMFSRQAGGSALCSGDSGGPTYVDVGGSTYQVGVHSRGNLKDSSIDLRTDLPESQAFLRAIAEDQGVDICGITKQCATISNDRYRK